MITLSKTVELCKALAQDVRQSGWQPCYVFGIASEGSVIAYYVAGFLDVPFAVAPVVLGARPRRLSDVLLPLSIRDRRVLIVDAAVETGTLLAQLSTLVSQLEGEPRTAAPVLIGPQATCDYHMNALRLDSAPQYEWGISAIATT